MIKKNNKWIAEVYCPLFIVTICGLLAGLTKRSENIVWGCSFALATYYASVRPDWFLARWLISISGIMIVALLGKSDFQRGIGAIILLLIGLSIEQMTKNSLNQHTKQCKGSDDESIV